MMNNMVAPLAIVNYVMEDIQFQRQKEENQSTAKIAQKKEIV